MNNTSRVNLTVNVSYLCILVKMHVLHFFVMIDLFFLCALYVRASILILCLELNQSVEMFTYIQKYCCIYIYLYTINYRNIERWLLYILSFSLIYANSIMMHNEANKCFVKKITKLCSYSLWYIQFIYSDMNLPNVNKHKQLWFCFY